MAAPSFEAADPGPRRSLDGGGLDDPTDATTAPGRKAGAAAAERLEAAVTRLVRADPDASAARRLVPWQAAALAVAAALVTFGLAVAPQASAATLFAVGTLPALAFLALRLAAIGELAPTSTPPADPGADLPVYTVMVPLYREAGVVSQLLAAIEALDYPLSRLDVLLIVEEGDGETIASIARTAPGPHMRVVAVPDGRPRTKPRALVYGLTFARGEYVVVFDAEDQPEPDQLKKALAAFRRAGPQLGCLQARLNIYNPAESWLTRQFTVEYTALFDGILPALERHGLPVMLGGTSNHFPRAVLEEVGGWDPFNVTEDADLGLRLARHGYHVGVLPSTTWEEAPARLGVWIGQRTRWLKGWMQTYLVHMRRPRRLWRELGMRRFLAVNLLTGGAVVSALIHPWIYALLAWDVAVAQVLPAHDGRLSATVWWLAGFNLLASYGAAIALGAAAARERGRGWLAASGLTLPFYWLTISLAAHRALAELVLAPHHWEKTAHAGRLLDGAARPEPRHR